VKGNLKMASTGLLPGAKRERHLTSLQERFSKLGLESLNNQEIIELLFSQNHPHRECKKRAKECIELFGNLRGLLSASPRELQEAGICKKCTFNIKLLQEVPKEFLKERIIERFVYKSPKEISDYLSYSMRDLKKEVFKGLYLNNRNQIIHTADLFEGTLESIPIRPREIVESAMKHNAIRLIFAHNHPAGDPKPSKSDKQLTRDMVFMGMILQIKVLDHIIIGDDRYFSFADEGLIQKYEDEFLNLRIKAVFDTEVDYKDFRGYSGKVSPYAVAGK